MDFKSYINDVGEIPETIEGVTEVFERTQGICPDGWVVPAREDWELLKEALGGCDKAAVLLKSVEYWDREKTFNGFNNTEFLWSSTIAP